MAVVTSEQGYTRHGGKRCDCSDLRARIGVLLCSDSRHSRWIRCQVAHVPGLLLQLAKEGLLLHMVTDKLHPHIKGSDAIAS